jgi:DNA-binding SARP family transcriptional activator/tetratricopeptide (TPR) repeat protein
MEFGLLGPVLVRRGGLAVPVPRGSQRDVLAALLLAAGQLVSLGQLTEVLWGEQPPPSAEMTVRNYVRRLRQTLGDTGRTRISTQPHGYLLTLADGELDVSRFEALLQAAFAALRGERWDAAAGQARQALALWRGEPLADVASDLLALREKPRLAEMRLHAAETWADAALRLGSHAEVAGGLERLAAAHPLREHLHALIMLARYRVGNPAGALAAYTQAREALISELGVEPGSELRELHRRILAQDPTLAFPAPRPTADGAREPAKPQRHRPDVPRELPSAVRPFVGRETELAELTALLGQAAGKPPGMAMISVIVGSAGVGKTALALQWAHQVANRFPDGQLYVNLRGCDPDEPMSATDALAGFLRALGVPAQDIPAQAAQRAARYRSLLAGRRVLVVLDDARSPEQVRSLLPGTLGCVTVVTSRDSLSGLVARDGAVRLDLDVLPPAAALELLRALMGDRVAAEPDAAAALAGRCGGLPLALRVAAELATASPAVSLARQAEAGEQILRHPSVAGMPGVVTGVRSSLPPDTAAFTGRDAELQLITSAVAETAGAGGGAVAIRVIDGMPGVGKTALAVHAAHRLASEFPDRRLLVDLHGYTAGREPVTPLDALAGLLAATGADPRFVPDDIEGRAGMWRDRMAGQRAMVVLDNAASSAQVTPLLPGTSGCLVLVTSRRHLADLPGTVVPVPVDVLPQDEAVRMFIRLAPRAAADASAAVAELARLAGSLPLAVSLLARVYARHPSWSLADLAAEARAQPLTVKAEQMNVAAAFEVSVAHLDLPWQRFFGCLGLHPGTSFDAYAAAALASVPLAEAAMLLDALHGEGLLTETARRRYGMHDLIRRYARDRASHSMTSRDQRRAVTRLLDYYQHTGGRAHSLLATLTCGAPVSRPTAAPAAAPRLADDRDALTWLRAEQASLLACLEQATTQRMPERVVALTAGFSELLLIDGSRAEAVTWHERAVQAAAELADQPGHAGALLALADAHWLAGNFAAAARTVTRALVMFGELGDRLGEANARVLLADTRRMAADYPAAAGLLERALSVFGELGDRLGQAQALLRLAILRRMMGELSAAAAPAQQALEMFGELGRRRDQAQALALLGSVRRDSGDYLAAITAVQQALDIYGDIGDRNGQGVALVSLGAAQRAAGNYPAAAGALVTALDIWRNSTCRQGRASALLHLGAVRRETHDYPAALTHLAEALRLFQADGDRGAAATVLTETGALHLARDDLAAAGHCYRQALDLARQISSPVDERTALAGLDRCARATAARIPAQPSTSITLTSQHARKPNRPPR